jgi:tetratricopeptide (TPR) repeat protein
MVGQSNGVNIGAVPSEVLTAAKQRCGRHEEREQSLKMSASMPKLLIAPALALMSGLALAAAAGPARSKPAPARHTVVAAAAQAQPAAPAAGSPASAAPSQNPQEIPQDIIDEFQCGSLANASGPWDYRDPSNRAKIIFMNGNHFNQDVQNLIRGQTAYQVLGDLDFLLRSVPNHYPALETTSRYFRNGGKSYQWKTMDCYFNRAMRFAPDDATVHVLYGVHLLKTHQSEKALQQFQEALSLDPDSAEIQYSVGLAFADVKDYKQANVYAAKAYQLGYPLLGLRHILERANAWNPPPPPPAATPAPTAAPTPAAAPAPGSTPAPAPAAPEAASHQQ